ncbi:MAG: preprotein translocase subunit SecG [Hyphomicrobiales bacterium]|nr:MAG: preprotein translocase subunit SecG [Hyphomicrobiales bacterium]
MFITILTYVLMFVEAISSLLLIGVILLQRTKGQGMGLAFGGGVGESLFGANMGNVLTKTTVIIGIIFLVNTTVLAYLGASSKARSIADTIAGSAVPVMPATQPMAPADDSPLPISDGGGVAIPRPVSIPSPAVAPEPGSVPISAPVSVEPTPVEVPQP